MKTIIIFFFGSLLSLAFASPVENSNEKVSIIEEQTFTVPNDHNKYEDELINKLNIKCSQNDLCSCITFKLVTYMNKLLKKTSIELTDDIEIRKTSPVLEEVPNYQPAGRSQNDETEILDLIASKVYTFIKSRSIKWKFLPEDDVVVSAKEDDNGALNLGLSIERSENAVQDGRGKKNNMGPILAAAVLKIGLIGGLAFKGLALLVGKALLLSKIALLLAGIIGLKKLFSQQKHVTYEVVAHPHHTASHAIESHGHSDYSGGWARNLQKRDSESAQQMAYSAHVVQ